MTRRETASRRRHIAAAIVTCLLILGGPVALATPVRAASTEFGPPSATSKFGTGVTFHELVTFAGTVKRIEILVTGPDAAAPLVTELPAGFNRLQELSYTVDASNGAMVPNTPLAARWRVTYADGRVDTGPIVHAVYADDRFAWRTKTAGIVTVHWYVGDDTFASRALQIAQQGINRAATLLGVSETAPVDFFIYSTQQDFYDAMGPGTRENVGGTAIPELRTLFGLITPDEINTDWVSIVIPHELTHLVFDTATKNAFNAPPKWLNEGLADYLSRGYNAEWRTLVGTAVASGTLMPLGSLAGYFPNSADRFALAYAESTSAIDFMVRTYGRPALVKLVRSYGSGVTDDEAFSAALGVDTAGFEAAWLADLGARQPRKYGPQPAPSGPVPSDWIRSPAPGGATPSVSRSGGTAGPSASTGVSGGAGSTGDGGNSNGTLLVVALVVVVAAVGGIAVIAMRGSRGPRDAAP